MRRFLYSRVLWSLEDHGAARVNDSVVSHQLCKDEAAELRVGDGGPGWPGLRENVTRVSPDGGL